MSQPQHKDALAQLFPLALGPHHEADLVAEGAALDRVAARNADLLLEAFGDTAFETVPRWERLLDLHPDLSDNMEARVAAIVAKLRALGGLSRAYFIQYAADLGYTIEIVEPHTFQAGVSGAGDRVYADSIIWCWRVDVEGADVPVSWFRAGTAAAGDRLGAFPVLPLIPLLNAIKPAHTLVYFEEPS